MDITLEQSLASAVRFIIDHDVSGTKAYFDEIPERFYVPSVYFPVPYVESKKASLRTYRNTTYFDAWVLAGTDWDAKARADSLRDELMLCGLAIPVMKEDGTPTGKSIKVKEPTHRRVDEGIVKLSFCIEDHFYRSDTHTKANNIVIVWKNIKERMENSEV